MIIILNRLHYVQVQKQKKITDKKLKQKVSFQKEFQRMNGIVKNTQNYNVMESKQHKKDNSSYSLEKESDQLIDLINLRCLEIWIYLLFELKELTINQIFILIIKHTIPSKYEILEMEMIIQAIFIIENC
ncbi:unnamed protein product [Paramecium pentaurelia]|uniref:Uncharacterized protein n=1 Tax=Paramecium pentaurelia TaxID=43138 RepID=A0A8S1SPI1_9CILI|nr:unnamed protein product [Paramecium pentaurelia]